MNEIHKPPGSQEFVLEADNRGIVGGEVRSMRRGERKREGCPTPHPTSATRGPGRASLSSPNRVRERAPAKNEF